MSIYPNGKLPISAEAQAYHIRRAQILAKTQAAHEAEQRKLLAQDIANAIQAKAPQSKGKSGRHERATGATDKWIAQQFNNYALPLIACSQSDPFPPDV